jgi:hypothetical protein
MKEDLTAVENLRTTESEHSFVDYSGNINHFSNWAVLLRKVDSSIEDSFNDNVEFGKLGWVDSTGFGCNERITCDAVFSSITDYGDLDGCITYKRSTSIPFSLGTPVFIEFFESSSKLAKFTQARDFIFKGKYCGRSKDREGVYYGGFYCITAILPSTIYQKFRQSIENETYLGLPTGIGIKGFTKCTTNLAEKKYFERRQYDIEYHEIDVEIYFQGKLAKNTSSDSYFGEVLEGSINFKNLVQIEREFVDDLKCGIKKTNLIRPRTELIRVLFDLAINIEADKLLDTVFDEIRPFLINLLYITSSFDLYSKEELSIDDLYFFGQRDPLFLIDKYKDKENNGTWSYKCGEWNNFTGDFLLSSKLRHPRVVQILLILQLTQEIKGQMDMLVGLSRMVNIQKTVVVLLALASLASIIGHGESLAINISFVTLFLLSTLLIFVVKLQSRSKQRSLQTKLFMSLVSMVKCLNESLFVPKQIELSANEISREHGVKFSPLFYGVLQTGISCADDVNGCWVSRMERLRGS